ncbi:MAG: hypothetical protein JXR77_14740 [Lentisphaeria bacterium]|nr:hypothetical protein [Lentisphaeria bacterium]
MANRKMDATKESQALRQELERRGLDPLLVWCPTPSDPELECRRLNSLLTWVWAYGKYRTREAMEAAGFAFPPIEPDCDPDTDWLRFEKWVNGRLVRESLRHKLAMDEVLGPPDAMTDAQIREALAALLAALARLQTEVLPCPGMPDRLAYEELHALLDEEVELLAPGTTCCIDGCSGYCPECLRRPWCEYGLALWPEDEDAGCMVVPESARRFLAPADMALDRLHAEA